MRSVVFASVLLFACGSDPGSTGVDAPPADAPVLEGTKYSLTWGPLTIPGSQDPGREGTKCLDLRLSNPTEIKVHQLHNVLFAGSLYLVGAVRKRLLARSHSRRSRH